MCAQACQRWRDVPAQAQACAHRHADVTPMARRVEALDDSMPAVWSERQRQRSHVRPSQGARVRHPASRSTSCLALGREAAGTGDREAAVAHKTGQLRFQLEVRRATERRPVLKARGRPHPRSLSGTSGRRLLGSNRRGADQPKACSQRDGPPKARPIQFDIWSPSPACAAHVWPRHSATRRQTTRDRI